MTKQLMHEWAVSSYEIAEKAAFRHQSSSSSGWLHTLLFWMDRSRQRGRLAELADLDDHLLRDIGVTRGEALREAEKPFWC
jgi:uncharacterized protein YjiS (DUF1127 family)